MLYETSPTTPGRPFPPVTCNKRLGSQSYNVVQWSDSPIDVVSPRYESVGRYHSFSFCISPKWFHKQQILNCCKETESFETWKASTTVNETKYSCIMSDESLTIVYRKKSTISFSLAYTTETSLLCIINNFLIITFFNKSDSLPIFLLTWPHVVNKLSITSTEGKYQE